MEILVESAHELGEGARLIDGALHYVDLLAGVLYRWDGREARPVLRSAEPVGVAAPVAGQPSWLVVAEGTGISWYDVGSGPARRVGQRELGDSGPQPGMRVNDGCVDPLGRLWVGTMPLLDNGPTGAVYVTWDDGGLDVVLDGIACPNGPAFTDSGVVYLADTVRQVVLRSQIDLETGDVGAFSAFATLDHGLPDGMAVDEEGGLWVAVWGAAEVRRYDPTGRLVARHPTPARQPTSVCLMSIEGQRRAVVTSARQGLADPTEWDGAVLAFDVDVAAPPARAWTGPQGPS